MSNASYPAGMRLEAGASLTEAITDLQRYYVDSQRETLLEGSFVDWLD